MGCDGGEHANRFLLHDNALSQQVLRNGVAIHPLAFFGEPFDKGCCIGYFATAFSQQFTLFSGHDARQIVQVFHHQFKQAAQLAGALFSCQGLPDRLRFLAAAIARMVSLAPKLDTRPIYSPLVGLWISID